MANQDIRGTRTEKNLLTAYLAESAAYTRYTFYAAQALKEGMPPVQHVFLDTAANELHHAKVFFKMLQGGVVEVPVSTDSGVIADTASNLATAMAEEETEGVEMYTAAAEVARQEGFDEIASHFEAIATIERHHRERFSRFLDHVKAGTLWHRDTPIEWVCLVCGYRYTGTEPPVKCPACDHPQCHYMAADEYC